MITNEEIRDDELFNVVYFYPDNVSHYELRAVDLESAMTKAKFATQSVAAQMHVLERVIITDMLDRTCFEWINGHGVIFPPMNA